MRLCERPFTNFLNFEVLYFSMVEKSVLQIDQNWFYLPPVHPDMTGLDKDLMLEALPDALRMAVDQLKESDVSIPSSLPYNSKEEFINSIESMLDEGITPSGGYKKDISVIKLFPFSRNLSLKINEDGSVEGLGRLSLLQSPWCAYLTQGTYDSIPETVTASFIDEFDLYYKFNDFSEHTPHFFRTDPEKDGTAMAWCLADAYGVEELFFRNLTVAYTNKFLERHLG